MPVQKSASPDPHFNEAGETVGLAAALCAMTVLSADRFASEGSQTEAAAASHSTLIHRRRLPS